MRNVGDDMGMGDGSGLDEAGLDGLRADDLRTPPRELVVASAGAGKTYRLSTRIIELLAAGAPPEEIFASTFTRKAAGEILERVLLRLAEGGQAPVGMKDPELSQEACIRLLELLLPRLHAVNVGTLDSFFQRMARAFSLELGFPPAWTLSDGPTEARLQGDAVTRLLGSTDTGGVLELLRLLQAGEARRGVHDALVDEVGQLHDTFQELDPNVPDPWGFPETNERAADQEGPSDRTPVTRAELDQAARAIREAEVPRTKAGKPNKSWAKAREAAAQQLQDGDMDAFLDGGLPGKVLEGATTYYRASFPVDLRVAVERGLKLARRILWPELQTRTRALARLLKHYHAEVGALRKEEGLYRFSDVTRALAQRMTTEQGAELHYRLDARIRHILLDEFQDTSLAQWWVLRPLVAEIVSGYEGERGAVIVADPKQSIYGWRGGEPRILEAIERDFSLPKASLHESWRSSPVVLDFVNRIFEGLEASGVIEDRFQPAVQRWLQSFTPHRAHFPKRPGHVRVEVGPEGDNPRAGVQPRLLAAAADRVVELHDRCPGASIGVLVRTNKGVARLMAELRKRGVDASEEGGMPVSDSSAVLCLLALLRLADHPGDRIAAYQVASTPVRELPEVVESSFEWRSPAAAEELASRVRRRLAMDGYGPAVTEWVRLLEKELAPETLPRDRRRLRQLAELAYRWDEEGGSLRPTDFVRWVEEERMEEPSAAPVRVMTIHQSKGLEFDVVILPDLDRSLLPRGDGGVLPYRPRPDGPIARVFPAVKKAHRPLFPEAEKAAAQKDEGGLRDGLSGLYVGLTRARHGLEVLIRPDGKTRSSTVSGALLIREALGVDRRVEPRELLFEEGNREWWLAEEAPKRLGRTVSSHSGPTEGQQEDQASRQESESAPGGPPATRRELGGRGPAASTATPSARSGEPASLFRSGPSPSRRRLLPRRSPSELEGGGRRRLGHLLLPGARDARLRGSLVHAWFEAVGWLPDQAPDRGTLERIRREVAPSLEEDGKLMDRFYGWLEEPEIHAALSRDAYPGEVRLYRERPFLIRREGALLQGVVDRLVVGSDDLPQAWILDYKTDRPRPGLVAHYRPQLQAYRDAVAQEEGLDPGDVSAALVLLEEGRVVEV